MSAIAHKIDATLAVQTPDRKEVKPISIYDVLTQLTLEQVRNRKPITSA